MMNPFSINSLQDGRGAVVPQPLMPVYRAWFVAAEQGDWTTLQALRPQVDINASVSMGTALALAAAHRQEEVVSYLIEQGADVNARGKSQKGVGLTPLLAITAHGHRHGASPSIVRALLRAGAKVNDTVPATGNTPLLYLAISTRSTGLVRTMRQLIEAGADPNQPNKLGQTALHRAMENAFLGENVGEGMQALRLLLESGAQVDLPDLTGRTALFYALSNHPHRTQLLLQQGFNPNHQDREGKTPLMHADASSRNRQGHIQMLLDHGANPAVFDGSGASTWHHLARCPDLDLTLLERLLSLSDSIPDTQDALGETVLSVAASHARQDLVVLRWLLDQGCRADQVDANGVNPALKASSKGIFAAYSLLVEYGADPCGRDALGRSVLHHAVRHLNRFVLEQALLHNALLDIQDNTGMTALHYAAKTKNTPFLRSLLGAGANPTLATPEGHLPEHLLFEFHEFRRELESYRERYQLEASLPENARISPSLERPRL